MTLGDIIEPKAIWKFYTLKVKTLGQAPIRKDISKLQEAYWNFGTCVPICLIFSKYDFLFVIEAYRACVLRNCKLLEKACETITNSILSSIMIYHLSQLVQFLRIRAYIPLGCNRKEVQGPEG